MTKGSRARISFRFTYTARHPRQWHSGTGTAPGQELRRRCRRAPPFTPGRGKAVPECRQPRPSWELLGPLAQPRLGRPRAVPTSGRRQPRTLRPPGAPRTVPGTRRSPTATEGTWGAPTPLAPGLAAVRGPAARGAPRASQHGERGCRLSSPRGPSSAGSGSPRCPASAALPAHPRPGRRRRSRCARSPRPPARSRPGAADASTWLMGESAPRQGAESGGGLSSAAPPPRGSPRACPASAAGPASAIPQLGLPLHRPGRSCSPVYSCPVRLSSEGRSSASRSQIHSGKKASRPPRAALGWPVLRLCPRVPGLPAALPVLALLRPLLLCPARNFSGSKQPGFQESLSSPCLFPSSTVCTYGNFFISKIVYMFPLSAWGKKKKKHWNYIPWAFSLKQSFISYL